MNLLNRNEINIMENIIETPKFAYFIGFFAADGCYYKDRCGRFEFCDGNSIIEEQKYSEEFLDNLKQIIESLLNIKISEPRKKENKYVLQFRSKKLEEIFQNQLNIKPEPKTFTFKVPRIYLNNSLEKFFWLGVMDGDGMIARNARKIALEMANKSIINKYKLFLLRNHIKFSEFQRCINDKLYYKITINSAFFKKYMNVLGFLHPRKSLWARNHLKKKDFYVDNRLIDVKNHILKNNIIDYTKLFENADNIFIVNGKEILEKFNINYKGRKNIKFNKIYNELTNKKVSKLEILKEISKYRWKMSKGSTTSVKMPTYFDKRIYNVAELIRLRNGGITISKQYIKTYYNKNPDKIINIIKEIFDIEPKYSCKNIPLFCSSVVNLFFSKIIKRQENNNVILPNWHEDLI